MDYKSFFRERGYTLASIGADCFAFFTKSNTQFVIVFGDDVQSNGKSIGTLPKTLNGCIQFLNKLEKL